MCRILLLLSLAVLALTTDVTHKNPTSQLNPDKPIVINNYYSMNGNNGPLEPEYPKSGDCATNKDCSSETACVDNYCVDSCSICADNTVCLTKDHTAACSCGDGMVGDPFTGCTHVDCKVDNDCAQDRACVNNHCVDPCSNALCGTNTDCHVKNHTAACSCATDYIGNPFTGCKLGGTLPTGYKATDGRYFLYYHVVNWFEALAFCAKQGLHLASFDNEEDFNKLVKLINTSSQQGIGFWIGAMNLGSRGTFRWAHTGKALTYSAWRDMEPSGTEPSINHVEEDCVEILNLPPRKMNDISCLAQTNAICEK